MDTGTSGSAELRAEMRAALVDTPCLEPEPAPCPMCFSQLSLVDKADQLNEPNDELLSDTDFVCNPEFELEPELESNRDHDQHELGAHGDREIGIEHYLEFPAVDRAAMALLFPQYSDGFTDSPTSPEDHTAITPSTSFSTDHDSGQSRSAEDMPGVNQSDPIETFGLYKALKLRKSAPSAESEVFFSPDVRLSPFEAAPGVFKVLKSNPQLRDPCVRQGYTLISHGSWSHMWSLMPDTYSGGIVRPLATFETPTYHLGSGYASINDMKALIAIRLMLFPDSTSANHLEFMKCDDYRYEWRRLDNKDEEVSYLWQHRLVDGQKRPAALLRHHSRLFRSPVNNSSLWSVEVDIDRIDPITAFLSAFCLMRRGFGLTINSFLSGNTTAIASGPPQPLVNVVFEDEGRVLQRESKFHGEWDAESGAIQSPFCYNVKVFSVDYLNKYRIPEIVLAAINKEATDEVMALRMQYGIYYV